MLWVRRALNNHLVPALGHKPLHQVAQSTIQPGLLFAAHRDTRWQHIFHLLFVFFSRTVQGKALKVKPTSIFESSKTFRTLLELSKAIMHFAVHLGCFHTQLTYK